MRNQKLGPIEAQSILVGMNLTDVATVPAGLTPMLMIPVCS
jgi:hypothetical protein